MTREKTIKLYAAIAQLEEMVMEKAQLDAQIAVLKLKSERLKQDIFDFESDYIEDYELPDYHVISNTLSKLSK